MHKEQENQGTFPKPVRSESQEERKDRSKLKKHATSVYRQFQELSYPSLGSKHLPAYCATAHSLVILKYAI